MFRGGASRKERTKRRPLPLRGDWKKKNESVGDLVVKNLERVGREASSQELAEKGRERKRGGRLQGGKREKSKKG